MTAPYFGFLDDDDYLLPRALATRVHALAADPSAAAVVSNGYLADGGVDAPVLRDIARIRRNPLESLMQGNWLATASALFRTPSVPPDFFDVAIRSIDMTYVAFRVALSSKVLFLDAPTYRKTYSPDSISITEAWALPALATLEKMLAFDMPAAVRRGLRRKCSCVAHQISDIHRRRGETKLAWRFHLRSLREPRGALAYALYTRRLLLPRHGTRTGVRSVDGAPQRGQ